MGGKPPKFTLVCESYGGVAGWGRPLIFWPINRMGGQILGAESYGGGHPVQLSGRFDERRNNLALDRCDNTFRRNNITIGMDQGGLCNQLFP